MQNKQLPDYAKCLKSKNSFGGKVLSKFISEENQMNWLTLD